MTAVTPQKTPIFLEMMATGELPTTVTLNLMSILMTLKLKMNI